LHVNLNQDDEDSGYCATNSSNSEDINNSSSYMSCETKKVK